ncbi:PP2C family protein-serine/threonine phosphatase [Streptomyces sp. TLI_171]|uniref:PP2C family protein-serine/threonine phosphatase n=1 Tax=Streptomyces sp. TLI_171 TaxID=1938859 RepID=UPI000C1773D3|nr:PP2C family protein-serine/threonine phosphatase [Streptomyces sp. TLI_171]RKE16875.1 stage II sporulation protein E [Streptomyces sp. TLI_171]
MPTEAVRRAAAAPLATRTVALVVAVVVYGLVLGLEFGASQPSHAPSLLVTIPAVVALAFRTPVVLAAAALAVGTRWLFLPLEPGRLGAAIGTSAASAAIAAVASFAESRRRREAARLMEVISVAETAQRALLRPPPPQVGPYRIAASYRAAAQFARIGGDLYAVADTAFGLRLLIGDVRGKGLEAVATGAVVLGCFHETVLDHPTLGGLAQRLEASLRRYLTDAEGFVTALLVEITPDGRMRTLSCGHPPPLLLRDGEVRDVPAPLGLPLGLADLPPAADPVAATTDTQLHPGDTVLLYTDGIAEARDAAGEFYPLGVRLAALLRSRPGPTDPEALLDRLQQDALGYADGGTHDDAALLALTWTQPVGPD